MSQIINMITGTVISALTKPGAKRLFEQVQISGKLMPPIIARSPTTVYSPACAS